MVRAIAIVLHPGFQLLDAAGPIAAFEMAERLRPGSYRLIVIAPEGGQIVSSAGPTMAAEALDDRTFDTAIVAGGEIISSRKAAAEIVAWLQQVKAQRIASVCSGAYLLAEARLLDGRSATTHWKSAGDFGQRYPTIKLCADRIFVRDGEIWTSAGIAAGIDLALALIEDDLGPAIAEAVAQQLVVPRRRPGGQSQYAGLVELGGRSGRFVNLIEWIRANLRESLTIERLADHSGMSPRNFTRSFTSETGTTPAKAVERLRLEEARIAVESSHEPIDRIAQATGFGEPGRMRRAFIRSFGQPPQALRRAARR
jgi:transcriptional regulator GlxA family with amidase domain